jgi:CubicO group peptidase (beta-lactamase class C family)
MRALLIGALMWPALALAAPCPVRASWPTTEWPSTTELTAATKAAAIAELERFAFTLQGADADRIGTRTDAVVIVHGGAVVYERYARSWTASMPHYVWSVTKSFTNVLTGIAVGAGLVRLDDSICNWLAAPADHCVLSIQNLLEFSSGMDWVETYEGRSNQVSSVLAMLYGEGSTDMVPFILSHRFRDPPGETYMYSSGDSTLLASATDEAMKAHFGDDYEWTQLFDRIGMASAVAESDQKGHPVGSSWLYATPRDLAKFGFFLLSDGCWDGQRILPEEWVAQSTAVSEPFKKRPLDTDVGDVQGRQLWLNRPVPEQNVVTPWPDVPEDAFAARGHWGQSITVIPSLDVVVVRLADDRDGTFDFNGFLARAIAVAQ